MKYHIIVIFMCALLLSNCARQSTQPRPQLQPAIKDLVKQNFPENVYIGATISYPEWGSPAETLLNQQFNYITPANAFKQSYVHPEPGKWRWEYPDIWINKASENNQLVRIHGPISPQSSKWAKEDHRTKEEMDVMLEEFLVALIKRYNGHPNVQWFDVVNEVITEDGQWFGPKSGTDLWENPWTILGFRYDIPDKYPLLKEKGVPIYVIKAFEIATQYATDMKLMINQHRLTSPESIALMKELIVYLKDMGLRVDALGWQAHIRSELEDFKDPNNHYLIQLDELVKWSHNHGLAFHITENNIHYLADSIYDPTISKVYINLIKVLLNNRYNGEVGWNLWTLQDKPHYAEANKQLLGLWDKKYQPQPAYHAFVEALQQAD